MMSDKEQAEELAARLLPLHAAKTTFKCKENQHGDCYGVVQDHPAGDWSMCVCNCHFRHDIAAALQAKDEEIARLVDGDREKSRIIRLWQKFAERLGAALGCGNRVDDELLKFATDQSAENARLKARCEELWQHNFRLMHGIKESNP